MEKKLFNIQATGAAFETLSSRLYSDPVLAVIRELSTNANDAHIEAGVDKPFKLHIPTDNEPWFDIRDYGNGLSEDLISNIYTTFFMSTKQEDESQTGYFGLGSKTPFALVDSYNVISYNGGKKATYKMDKIDGCPAVEKISEEPSSETGLEVYFEYDKDFWTFKNRTIDFFKGTSFMPEWNLDNDDIDWVNYAKEREYYSDNNISFGSHYEISVNVAGVKFNVSSSDLQNKNNSVRNAISSVGAVGINIMAKKNDVTITPSREELHYDAKTINFISTKIIDNITSLVSSYLIRENDLTYKELMLMKEQTIDSAFSERCAKKIADSFYKYAIYAHKSSYGRGKWIISLVNPSSIRVSDINNKKIKILDFRGIESATKKKVVDNFLTGQTVDDSGRKITSTSFTGIIKSISDNDGYYFIPSSYDKYDDLKKIMGSECETLLWKDLSADNNSSKAKRKTGFKTRLTEIWHGTNYNTFYGDDPNLEDDEIGLICTEGFLNSGSGAKAYIRLINYLSKAKGEESKHIALRPCKESVFEKYHKNYPTIQEFTKKIMEENKDIILNDVKISNIKSYLSNVFNSYEFSQSIYDEINNPKYNSLDGCPAFDNIKKYYTKENFKSEPSYMMEDYLRDLIDIKDVEKPEENFNGFPMIQYMSSYSNFDSKKVGKILSYMKVMVSSGAYQEELKNIEEEKKAEELQKKMEEENNSKEAAVAE